MSRYLVTICDEMGCREVGRANTSETAAKKAVRAARRAAKRWKGLPVPDGEVKATVYPVDRGIVQDDDPVFEAKESYGAPRKGRSKKRRAKLAPPEPVNEPWDGV